MNKQAHELQTDTAYRVDEIDRRIIYALMTNARDTSAPMIAEEVNVSAGTIRNRIHRLEDNDILTGYHTQVDFERIGGRFTHLFMCNAPFEKREIIAQQVQTLPGVINVRELMGGRMNLHILAVGRDTDDLHRIGRSITELGVEIEDEVLVQNESDVPYAPFGPDDQPRKPPTDFISLAGDSEVTEVTVRTDAPIAGLTLQEAGQQDLLDDDILIITIERDGTVLTPHGETEIWADDVVTVFAQAGIEDGTLDAFLGDETS
ncbi:HTH-type transcriptional regulator Ptr1 [Halalkalicoccus paucihalophilus]|uniref:HTH-type transcriptional regulator Ptr1 n=1 Tax=Halalkalicoccus paucihalophilus TaxID=1008153 RepID=A0A151ABA6_9EURY|nr:TrkA C-terminal domain-containing protein [Halalkalicoccus paucihalophilus]KYH24840.1 HTH-type transcriptional regulator Ptr1 [Halalkalicoccus paucihalophilus]